MPGADSPDHCYVGRFVSQPDWINCDDHDHYHDHEQLNDPPPPHTHKHTESAYEESENRCDAHRSGILRELSRWCSRLGRQATKLVSPRASHHGGPLLRPWAQRLAAAVMSGLE